jgi:hypothetical protein
MIDTPDSSSITALSNSKAATSRRTPYQASGRSSNVGGLVMTKFIRSASIAGAVTIFCASILHAQPDPLPSWHEGAPKKAILNFVTRVSRKGGADFVAIPERIAVFDNDGTLWSEQPIYFQVAFVLDRVKALAPQHPEWKEKEPFKAVMEGDLKTALAGGEHAIIEMMVATHTGLTTEEFEGIVKDWVATARHPRFKRPYTDLVFQPMLELLGYLRASGFKTYIVSAAASNSCGRGPRESTEFLPSRSSAAVASSNTKSRMGNRSFSNCLKLTLLTIRRASPSASRSLSADVRSPLSATLMATSRCFGGLLQERGFGSE